MFSDDMPSSCRSKLGRIVHLGKATGPNTLHILTICSTVDSRSVCVISLKYLLQGIDGEMEPLAPALNLSPRASPGGLARMII
jgi:hypothetical protein